MELARPVAQFEFQEARCPAQLFGCQDRRVGVPPHHQVRTSNLQLVPAGELGQRWSEMGMESAAKAHVRATAEQARVHGFGEPVELLRTGYFLDAHAIGE